MRFPPQFLDELRARLPVSEVVGKRVRLKKAGREWKGLSPFNKERTPSFFVNDHKGFYHDFSSGKHGDIFTFTMEMEGVTFPEAVERLAALAGLAMPRMSREAEAEEGRRRTLHEVVALAARFFEESLASRAGAKARGYLADRGLNAATQLKFRIGYAPPDRFALKEHLGGLGVSVEDMVEAGLLVAGDNIPLPYDRFRDRVMFPIGDFSGRIVAFGGRALDKDAPAKYLNSPETPLFHKGRLLYNAAGARKAAHQGAPVIAVEGYVDVIAMVTAGFEATVAPLGTALTEDQLALLWKMADEPILCFDGDAAGRRAAYRAIDLALPHITPGKSLRFASLPQGQDPDDLVRSGGADAMTDVLTTALPLADMLWMRETEGGRFETPERRAGLEARIDELANAIVNETVRRYYRQDLRQRLRNLLMPVSTDRPAQGGFGRGAMVRWRERNERSRSHARGRSHEAPLAPLSPQLQTSSIIRGSRSALPPREALILLAAFNHPWLLETQAEQLADVEFLNGDADVLRRVLLDITASRQPHRDADRTSLREAVLAKGCGAALQRIEGAVTHGADWPAREGAAPEDVRQWWAHVLTLHRRSRTLNKELKEAERAFGEELSEQNFAWLQDVRAQLSSLEGTEASIEGFGALSGRPGGGP
ncbi:MAG TPA: DNA primase [Xanthobacteraceae bacterium]|jgi:DNA primase|nr:DNA primase [Xanthobacteraceae bacterium]